MTLALRQQEDWSARHHALTGLDQTILVEAGAGSGKTSILAGRVLSLLATGRPPNNIAAITFTELAAGELRERIVKFAEELIDGHVRPDLEPAFGFACTADQRKALITARQDLDQLTCCTIYSFCQALLTPYPVEADMDPGATVMDREAADVLFQEIFDGFLRDRLSLPGRPDDLLVALFLADANATRNLLMSVAEKLRSRPDLSFPPHEAERNAVSTLRESVAAFRSFFDNAICFEPETAEIVQGLETLVTEISEESEPNPQSLIHLLRLAVPGCCATAGSAFRAYRFKGKWRSAARASTTLAEADRLNDEATHLYAACVRAHSAVRTWAATRVLNDLGQDCRAIVTRFTETKRKRALLDFDDLILKARNLLANRSDVREALGSRFCLILVDEFQDTDPLQCEILWRLAGVPALNGDLASSWDEWSLRPGALFLVGDPKQAIYRFRGADVGSYVAVRDRLREADPSSVVSVSQNFRSVDGILNWVNRNFEGPFKADQQPGFAHLFSAAVSNPGASSVATYGIKVDGAGAPLIRDAEAEAVAILCESLIGTHMVRDGNKVRPCEPDDIALLAPTGTELWRYERALEERGIPVSTQAGKGFFRRQEIQDLIALTRVLGDSQDTLALGAFLRGPMVGLTEEELLDTVADLPAQAGDLPRLTLWTNVEHVPHAVLRETLAVLQGLAKRARSTTPYILLCSAVEELQVRPIVRRRRVRTAERALANVDQFLELARPFDLQGLKAFADVMRRQWEEATRAMEARPDTQRPAVSLITMHSSKGLEWPVVAPINTATEIKDQIRAVLERRAGVLHVPVLGVHPEGSEIAIEAEKAELERERHRIWYVAATRARDLLVLPKVSCDVPKKSWLAMMSAGLETIEPLILFDRVEALQPGGEPEDPGPDRNAFEAQAATIRGNTRILKRITPHLAEAGDEPVLEAEILGPVGDALDFGRPAVRGSRARGLVLHKLLEEVLTGETVDNEASLKSRAGELAAELNGLTEDAGLDPAELACSVLRGLSVPDVAAVRHTLVPECWVSASRNEGRVEEVIIGIADAVSLDKDGRISLVIDWKSDVAPEPKVVIGYKEQVQQYLSATGAGNGLIVFVTTGHVERVNSSAETRMSDKTSASHDVQYVS